MKKIKFKEGDLFFISEVLFRKELLSLGNKSRVGKLIYISSYFKDMIGFIPSINTYTEKPENIDNIKFMNEVLYTAHDQIKYGIWEVIGHKNVTQEEVLLTKRRVGNTIMIKDEEIRICTENDYKKYKNQGIAGFKALHYLLMNLED